MVFKACTRARFAFASASIAVSPLPDLRPRLSSRPSRPPSPPRIPRRRYQLNLWQRLRRGDSDLPLLVCPAAVGGSPWAPHPAAGAQQHQQPPALLAASGVAPRIWADGRRRRGRHGGVLCGYAPSLPPPPAAAAAAAAARRAGPQPPLGDADADAGGARSSRGRARQQQQRQLPRAARRGAAGLLRRGRGRAGGPASGRGRSSSCWCWRRGRAAAAAVGCISIGCARTGAAQGRLPCGAGR